MTLSERLKKLLAERFGSARYTVEQHEGGGVLVRLHTPDIRRGDRATVFPMALCAKDAESGTAVSYAARSAEGEAKDDENICTFSFSSEAPVMNWAGQPEVLSHHTEDADFTRMATVGSILRNHNPSQIAGVPTKIWIDAATRKGMCIERFGTTEIAKQTQHEVVVDKTMRGVSVGFQVNEWVLLEGENTRYREIVGTTDGIWVAAKWQALEASHTPIPADPSVGIGRSTNAGNRTTEGDGMKKRMKLARDWNGHKAGDIVEVDEATAQMLREQKLGEDAPAETTGGTGTPDPANPNQPGTRQQPAAPAPQAQPVDVNRAIEAERARCRDIRALGKRMNVDVQAYIDGGNTVESVREAILEIVATRQQSQPTGSVQVTRDGIVSFRAAAANALRLSAGRKVERAELKDGGEDMRGMTLIEIARECDRRRGLSPQNDPEEVILRALSGPRLSAADLRHAETIATSTSDFPLILANVANKEMLAGAASVTVTWPLWAKRGSISDFKAASRLKLSEAGDLAEVAENAGYTTTKFSEQNENLTLKTWGKVWGMTRKMMINDDKQAFTEVPFALGRRAKYKPEILAIVELLANGNMSDGVALFHASHNNLSAVSGNAPGVSVDQARACIKALWLKLSKQSAMQHGDLSAEVALNAAASLKVILCGPTGYINLASAIGSTMIGTGVEGVNPLAALGLSIVSSPLLENALVTGNSTTAVYGFASPAESPVVEVAFLNGNDTPYQEEVENVGSAADGRLFKVRLDCIAGRIDYRGAVKEAGA